ncbi:TonB-dependent receptor domain-containing protein [Pontibacter silvestris]|uniref:TonB-dependent receptor domain-containing protein n=1 Tax=Pontibacter silvestris TaxID=2305183 RepID=A0ABW4X2A1_9BACT|nr:TonB-dependent receptor [Pontibacter silvestris]MCC9134908.1 TonB-dependent receptor [Pontibacter silvestris]
MKELYNIVVFILMPVIAQAQIGSISGQITGETGPVAYASVGIAGINAGATTTEEGTFNINNIPAGSYMLNISAIGFSSKGQKIKVKAGETTTVYVVLRQSASRLNEVVVTGTMRETYQLESPVPVEIYTPKYFQRNPTPAIFEALEMVNGVQPQVSCNVCGTGDIHINGMEGAYTMVLIDGMPIVSALSTVYGLSGIPNSLIERIEVVKGPASTLYGSEAMAGLINVITKASAKSPAVSADVFYTSHKELNADIGWSRRYKDASTILSTNYYRFQDWRDVNKDNFTDIPQQHRVSVFNKWSFNRQHNRLATVAARYYYEDRFGGELQWTPAYRGGDDIYGESVYTRRYELIGAYQLPLLEKVMLRYSYNDHKQNSAYGEQLYKAQQRVLVGQLIWDKPLSQRHNLLVGTSYRYTYYDDNTPATQSPDEQELKNQASHISLPGAFLEDELKFSPVFTLLTGLRYDYNSEHGSIFTPRLNLKWSPGEADILRLSLGNGYRVVNLFTEDHAALTGAREVVIKNKLKPERSYNISLNYNKYMNLNGGYINLLGTAFYTYFTNRIVGDFLTDNNKIIYDNLHGHAVSKGVALDAEVAFTFPLRLNAGVTLIDVYQVQKNRKGEEERVPQLHAPSFSGNFALSYTFRNAGLSLDYTGSVKGPMYLPVQEKDFRPEKSPWFTLQNIQLTKAFAGGLEVYGGLKNIFNFMPDYPLMRSFDPFDKQIAVNNPNNYTFDTEYNYAPLQGRRTYMGIRYILDK